MGPSESFSHVTPGASRGASHSEPRRLSRIHSLRVSVTDRCNFRCLYCMPSKGVAWLPHEELLSLEELYENVEWIAHRTDLQRVRLTGGEPLVRRGIHHLIARLTALPDMPEVSLTTNGAMLAHQVWALKAAGVSRVNISLDTMNPQRFTTLTRGGHLWHTLSGINEAIRAGLTPVKLNAVLQRTSWQEDVPRLLDYAAMQNVEIRFIELMRTGTERSWCASELVTVDVVQAWLARRAGIYPMPVRASSPSANTIVRWYGHDLSVGWITPRSQPFCKDCDRLRIDACGRVRRCLMDPATFNLPGIRSLGEKQAELAFFDYLAEKHAPRGMEIDKGMCQIGG
ncbi:MAG: GTP 3',8-cyclase MoaA [Acidobacteriota bacterium]|nr:GTP 3',8-cyclase MoaA [Acidobacteriota bacterium]